MSSSNTPGAAPRWISRSMLPYSIPYPCHPQRLVANDSRAPLEEMQPTVAQRGSGPVPPHPGSTQSTSWDRAQCGRPWRGKVAETTCRVERPHPTDPGHAGAEGAEGAEERGGG